MAAFVPDAGRGGATAATTPHRVWLAPHPAAQPAFEVATPDDGIFSGRLVGLAYFDRASGQTVILAEPREVVGELTAEDTVIYPDAFAGAAADVRYTLTRAGLTQDVILRANDLPDPADFGLDPASTRLEVVTEFFDFAPAVSVAEAAEDAPEAAARNLPAPTDATLDFGGMRIGPGRAFTLGDEDAAVAVTKHFEVIDGHALLFEGVALPALRPQLDRLGQRAAVDRPRRPAATSRAELVAALGTGRVSNPSSDPLGTANVPASGPALALLDRRAAASDARPGVVLDWTMFSTTTLTLAGDTTYYVSGAVTVTNLVIEGGAVVKFTNSPAAGITVNGPVATRTGPFRPAIFTAKDDNSVGEPIPGATGNPTATWYGAPMLRVQAMASTLRHLRFSHAAEALRYEPSSSHELEHAQFVRCAKAVIAPYAGLELRNALIHQATLAFDAAAQPASIRAQHVTFSQVSTGLHSTTYTGVLYATNCVFAQVGTVAGGGMASAAGFKNGFFGTAAFGSGPVTLASSPFETVGNGAHYLAYGSPAYDAGTTGITPSLLAALASLTCRAPVEITTNFTASLTLPPWAWRDTNAPDLGYHYAPLDYVWTARELTNATLTLTNGVGVGIYGVKGLTLRRGAVLRSEGAATALNRLTRVHLVQEQWAPTNSLWGTNAASLSLLDVNATTPKPVVDLRFTEVTLPGNSLGRRQFILAAHGLGSFSARDSRFYHTRLELTPTLGAVTVALTNCLVERPSWSLDQAYSGTPQLTLHLRNLLVRGGSVAWGYQNTYTPWTIHDNLWDGCAISSTVADVYNYPLPAAYNAHRGSSAIGSPTKNLTTCDYVAGPLGDYYYPTAGTNLYSLVNWDTARTPAALGLYHHTVSSSLTKEAATHLDAGFHYVATDAAGRPADTDGEGLPDHVEDRDGDGIQDAGESSLASADSDSDGDLDVQEILWGTNPLSDASRFPRQLASFGFDAPGFAGDQGQVPLQATGTSTNQSPGGVGAVCETSGGVLRYRVLEPSGARNMTFRNGALRFWYNPSWSSPLYSFGADPGPICLVSAGDREGQPSLGWFELGIKNGTNIYVWLSSDGTPANTLYLDTVLNPTSTNPLPHISPYAAYWQEVVCNLFQDRVTVYWNGSRVLALPFTSIPYLQPGGEALGMTIGGNYSGTLRAKGTIDELECYSFPLEGPGRRINGFSQLEATIVNNPLAVHLRWKAGWGNKLVGYTINRKLSSEVSYSAIANNVLASGYVDTNVTAGATYDYRIGNAEPAARIFVNTPASQPRRKILLVFDQTLGGAIQPEFDQFQQDLSADGWDVETLAAPRHDDTTWSNNVPHILALKNSIAQVKAASGTNLAALLFIGHVVIPMTGIGAEDNHSGCLDPGGWGNPSFGNHFGAWHSDLYYADHDSVWTDTNSSVQVAGTNEWSGCTNINPLTYVITINVPGDGKFDQRLLVGGTQRLDLAFGRIDFAKLDAFHSPPDSTLALTENQLLKRYFQKNHAYRHKGMPDRTLPAVAANTHVPWTLDGASDQSEFRAAMRYASASAVFPSALTVTQDFLRWTNQPIAIELGVQYTTGGPNALQTFHRTENQFIWSTNFVAEPTTPRTIFSVITASWSGDWNLGTDNVLRSLLASPHGNLAVMWHMDNHWNLRPFAWGGCLAEAQLDSYENSVGSGPIARTMEVLGDITLRRYSCRSVEHLHGNATGGIAALKWRHETPGLKFRVSRSTAGPLQGFSDLGETATAQFSAPQVAGGTNWYLVRPINTILAPLGSQERLGQGRVIAIP